MERHQADAPEQTTRRPPRKRPACPQWYVLGLAVGCTVADLSDTYGPCTTCYNRFVRWRRAGVWDRIMEALTAAYDATVQMIDTSVERVHQHGACIAENREQHIRRSRRGLTGKLHAAVGANGLPVRLDLTPGEAHDNRLCP
jgi:transposase